MVGIDVCIETSDKGVYDLIIDSNGDFLSQDFFDTAIFVSLLSDRRANESEVLRPENRRGWIGNEDTPDFEQGSKIWLFEQSRLTTNVLNDISSAAKDSLEWLVQDGFAKSIDSVIATRTLTGVTLEVVIRRPNSEVDRRFYDLWENTAVGCVDRPTHFSINYLGHGMNIFNEVGNPDYPVNVIVNSLVIPSSLVPCADIAGLLTGGPWHPDSTITLFIGATGPITGGGGSGDGAGGNGGNVGLPGDAGSGAFGMDGGLLGPAIITNGHSINFIKMGTIHGGII